MQLVPIDLTQTGFNLPAYLQDDDFAAKANDLNKEVVRAAMFPTMSIKGKVFSITRDGQRQVLTRPDPDEPNATIPAPSVGVVMIRANMKAKVYYAEAFNEGSSDGTPPTCYSQDGVVPSPHARVKQHANCAQCPRNVWGSRVNDQGEAQGKECADNARVAISVPDKVDPILLRVPPASLKPLRELLKLIATRKIPYNAVVTKMSFDAEAASPKLKFKAVGVLPEQMYREVEQAYDSEIVRAICGLDDTGVEQAMLPPPDSEADELDAALQAQGKAPAPAAPAPAPAAAKRATKPKAPAPAPAAPAPAPAAAPTVQVNVQAPAPAPAPTPAVTTAANLLDDLDSLLGATDD
jgi:hypothetical protein